MKSQLIWICVLLLLINCSFGCQRKHNSKRQAKLKAANKAVKKTKIWKYGVTGNRKPYNYIDEDGELKGFEIDIITTACTRAEEMCEFAIINSTDCVNNDEELRWIPGQALIDGVLDGCPGRSDSEDKYGLVSFTESYALSTPGKLFVLPGNPSNVSDDNLVGKIVAHFPGATNNGYCLRDKFGVYGGTYKIVANLDEAFRQLENGEIDTLLAARTYVDGLEALASEFPCATGDQGVMLPPVSGMTQWFDPALQEMKDDGTYDEICEESEEKHGRAARCL